MPIAWDTEEIGLSSTEGLGFAVNKGGLEKGRTVAICASQEDADEVAAALNLFEAMEEI